MKIAIEGCAHGELERIYDTIRLLEEKDNVKIDLLICCGDFQSSRNETDLKCMAVPQKYRDMCTFYKYYNGEKVAPILTIFIGGNHEASNYLQELPYGGWVAHNIYYLGYAGVVNIKGIRIGGISGIYKGNDFLKGRHEHPPYSDSSIRSVYHIRNLEVFRLKQLCGDLDIFLSHDWPTNITRFGNVNQLIRFKPHFQDDINSGKLGSPPCESLLKQLRPRYWFSAHLHCKFAALVPHDGCSTRFLALDKCLPRRRFLQVVDIPDNGDEDLRLCYDLEWLAILHQTNHLLSVKNTMVYMPGPSSGERYEFTPTTEEKKLVSLKFEEDFRIPLNFVKTAPAYDPTVNVKGKLPMPITNPQTVEFCDKLGIDDPLQLLLGDGMLQTSYVEADESNRTFNVTSFINDSDISSHEESIETSTPNKSRVRLSLPAPKLGNSTVGSDEFSDDSKIENISPIKRADFDMDLSSLKSGVIAESSPISKRFKRRNGDMYLNDNE